MKKEEFIDHIRKYDDINESININVYYSNKTIIDIWENFHIDLYEIEEWDFKISIKIYKRWDEFELHWNLNFISKELLDNLYNYYILNN